MDLSATLAAQPFRNVHQLRRAGVTGIATPIRLCIFDSAARTSAGDTKEKDLPLRSSRMRAPVFCPRHEVGTAGQALKDKGEAHEERHLDSGRRDRGNEAAAPVSSP